jgi:hypothetical protein
VVCVDIPRADLLQLVCCLKQNGYLWTKGQAPDGYALKLHSHYAGGFNLYVKQSFND